MDYFKDQRFRAEMAAERRAASEPRGLAGSQFIQEDVVAQRGSEQTLILFFFLSS